MPPIRFAINSYQSRALPLSAQQLVNYFAEAAPNDAKSPVVLLNGPGIKAWAPAVGNGPIRGTEKMDGMLYAVSGCTLYSVDANGKAVPLGSIHKGGVGEPGISMGAAASFSITGGTAGAGNQITSITVDGDEILAGPVTWATSNEVTAEWLRTIFGQYYKLFPGPDITSKDISAENTVPVGLSFSSDGTKMYSNKSGSTNKLFQYSLATPWMAATATYDSVAFDYGATSGFESEKVSGGDGVTIDGFDDAVGHTWNSDGTKLYFSEATFSTIYEVAVSRAWDLSSATHTYKQRYRAGVVSWAMSFNNDGTRMYIFDNNSDITQHSLSTAYLIASGSPDGITFNPASESGAFNSGNSSYFAANGYQFFVVDQGLSVDALYQFTMRDQWDLSTAVYDSRLFEVGNQDTSPMAMFIDPTGEEFYMVGRTASASVYQYSFGTTIYVVRVAGSQITISADDGSGPALNGSTVVITTTGDMQVDDNNLTMAGGFIMPGSGGEGTTPGCINKVSMSHNDADPSQLVIVDGTNGWIYTTTGGLVEITDDDFYPSRVVDFQDGYFVFIRDGTGQWFLSNLNDGTLYTATDIATAEGDPDNLVSLISQRRELWLFGAETIEIWYNSGSGSPPFSRYEGGFIERGCAAAFSIAEDDNSLFWLGEDRIFYRADGYQPVRISQHGIEEALRKYAVIDDACAFIYTMSGHKFYVVTFPAEDHTWVYDIATKLWHERQSFGMGRWRVSTHIEAYGKHLVGDFQDGKIGELDLDTYAEYGVTMQGLATGSVIHADRTRISHRRFELDIESGVGLTTGQGSDPLIWLSWSDDGGRTWSARKPFRSMGKLGEYQQRLRWNRMGSARERIYKVVVSDPVKRSIVAAHLNPKQGRA